MVKMYNQILFLIKVKKFIYRLPINNVETLRIKNNENEKIFINQLR